MICADFRNILQSYLRFTSFNDGTGALSMHIYVAFEKYIFQSLHFYVSRRSFRRSRLRETTSLDPKLDEIVQFSFEFLGPQAPHDAESHAGPRTRGGRFLAFYRVPALLGDRVRVFYVHRCLRGAFSDTIHDTLPAKNEFEQRDRGPFNAF